MENLRKLVKTMNFQDSKLPYPLFKLIRNYVGEKYNFIKNRLGSHVYEHTSNLFRNVYGEPELDNNGVLYWTVHFFKKEKHPKIVALGKFEYVRTIPVMTLSGPTRQTILFESPSRIWRWLDFLHFLTDCETALREDYNNRLGPFFFDGLDIVVLNQKSKVFPFQL